MGRFDSYGDPVITNRHVFDDQFIPDEMLCREDEEDRYTRAFIPLQDGNRADHVMLYGQTGTGKTLATEMIMQDLEVESKSWDQNIEIISHNCNGATECKNMAQLANKALAPDDSIPENGYSASYYLNTFLEAIDESDTDHVVIILDEINHLPADSSILYRIPRYHEGYLENTSASLVGISNDFEYETRMSAPIRDTLRKARDITFDPYNAEEIFEILNQRATVGLRDGAAPESVLRYTSALSAQNEGSARYALDVLREAARKAENEDDTAQISEDHIDTAVELIREDKVKDALLKLSKQSLAVLYTLLLLQKDGKTPIRRSDLHDVYKTVAQKHDLRPKGEQSISDELSELSLNGFTYHEEENLGREGGRRYLYEINMDLDVLESALAEVSAFVELDTTEASGNQTLTHYS